MTCFGVFPDFGIRFGNYVIFSTSMRIYDVALVFWTLVRMCNVGSNVGCVSFALDEAAFLTRDSILILLNIFFKVLVPQFVVRVIDSPILAIN